MNEKIPPYKTSSGVEIGKYYTPPRRVEYSATEEQLQSALIDDPLNDGMEDLGRLILLIIACIVALGVLFVWVTV